AAAEIPLTVYGRGRQRRGFLAIRDTLRCVELTVENPPPPGEYRVFNQFTETFSIAELACLVAGRSRALGWDAQLEYLENPRIEAEEHYYNPTHSALVSLGLEPHVLASVLENGLLHHVRRFAPRIKRDIILPRVRWS
ncbi:MAG: NAD-dependent dehydratase, partial [Terriglobales bacterium]